MYHMRMYMYIHTYVYAYVYICICMHILTHTCINTNTWLLDSHAFIYIYIYIYIHAKYKVTKATRRCRRVTSSHTYVYTYMPNTMSPIQRIDIVAYHLHIHMYIHTCKYKNTHTKNRYCRVTSSRTCLYTYMQIQCHPYKNRYCRVSSSGMARCMCHIHTYRSYIHTYALLFASIVNHMHTCV